jgi:hypothetical protein
MEAQISSLARFGDRIVPPMRLDRGVTRDYVFYRWFTMDQCQCSQGGAKFPTGGNGGNA